MSTKYITYEDYMENSNELYDAYYTQFANLCPSLCFHIRKNYTKEYILNCLDIDEHLNNIPLKEIDAITMKYIHELSTANGVINGTGSYSKSMGCSTIKTYMRQWTQN